MSLLLVEIGSDNNTKETLTYLTKHTPHTLFLSPSSFSPPKGNYRHIQYMVCVLFTLNRSLTPLSGWMRMWRERQCRAFVKGQVHNVVQVPAHNSWQGDSKQGRGSEEATTRMANFKPFWGHAMKCRSRTDLYSMCFLRRSHGVIKLNWQKCTSLSFQPSFPLMFNFL